MNPFGSQARLAALVADGSCPKDSGFPVRSFPLGQSEQFPFGGVMFEGESRTLLVHHSPLLVSSRPALCRMLRHQLPRSLWESWRSARVEVGDSVAHVVRPPKQKQGQILDLQVALTELAKNEQEAHAQTCDLGMDQRKTAGETNCSTDASENDRVRPQGCADFMVQVSASACCCSCLTLA